MDPRIVIHEPDVDGGRRVHVDSTNLGLAYSEMDLREFLRRAGLPDWDSIDITDAGMFRWEGGGPETWDQ